MIKKLICRLFGHAWQQWRETWVVRKRGSKSTQRRYFKQCGRCGRRMS